MAYQEDIALMAHLMRRAGFGATRDELEARAAKGYDATVEELLNPDTQPPVDHYTLLRYQPASLLPGGQPPMGNVHCMYYLVNTQRPLEEKMALFWHHVFATGNSKVDNYDQLLEQIELFRKNGLGNYRELLVDGLDQRDDDVLARQQPEPRHRGQRELGPRASRAVQSRRRQLHRDRRSRSSRAFTGWTFETKIPRLPYGRFPWKFEYRPEDHDDGEKTSSATRATSTARTSSTSSCSSRPARKFICRHLYNFFVADEPQVPAWTIEEPRDPAAIATWLKAFKDSKCEMMPVLRTLFKSDFFKNARFQHLKSPAEVVVSTLRLVGGYELPKPATASCRCSPPTWVRTC